MQGLGAGNVPSAWIGPGRDWSHQGGRVRQYGPTRRLVVSGTVTPESTRLTCRMQLCRYSAGKLRRALDNPHSPFEIDCPLTYFYAAMQ